MLAEWKDRGAVLSTAALLGRGLRLVAILFSAVWSCSAPRMTFGQSFANWDVIRVYIAESALQQVANKDYEVMPLDELVELLKREKLRQETAEFNSPGLNQAIYVASLEDKEIVSEQSRWMFSGQTDAKSLNLGTLSIALAKAQGNQLAGRDQLIGNHRVLPGGDVQIDLPGGEVERWFGFSMRPALNGDTTEYRFRLPLAASGVLLLSVPVGKALESKEVVLHPTDSPRDFVPSDWPAISQLDASTSLGRQWWVVYLSGASTFGLSVTDQMSNEGIAEGHVIDQARFNYVYSPNQLRLAVEYESSAATSGQWILEHSPKIRLESAVASKDAVDWEVLESDRENVTVRLVTNGPQLANEGSLKIQLDFEATSVAFPTAELPWVRVKSSSTISGTTRVRAEDGLIVEKLSGAKTARRVDLLGWSFDWTNQVPRVVAQFGLLENRLFARSFTKLNAQADWLSADCRLRLEVPKLNSNELAVRIGNGWFVDNATLLTAPEDVTLRQFESESGQGGAPSLLLVWNGQPQPGAIELEVSAHRPIRFQNETVQILSRKLLSVPSADQVDNYVISPSSNYRIELNDRLILSQIQVDDLPGWQQELLTGHNGQWLLQGRRNVTPQIKLREASGRYNSRMVAALIKDSSQEQARQRVSYYLRVEPLEQALDSVTISVPAGLNLEALQWKFQDAQQPGDSDVDVQILERGNAKQRCRLLLSTPRIAPFTLVASLPAQRAEETVTLHVLGLPDAVVAESTMVLSDDFSSIDSGENSFELLPLSACCGDGILSELVLEKFTANLHELIGARLEAKSHSSILLKDMTQEVVRDGWIWSESIQSLASDTDTQQHRVQWTVEASKTNKISIKLPKGWWLERALLNGAIVRSAENRVLNEIEISIPVMQTSQLELNCLSNTRQSVWLQKVDMPLPEVDFEVLQSRYRLLAPPSMQPLQGISRTTETTIWQRFNPKTWWSWLAPSSNSRLVELEYPGWTAIDQDSRLLESAEGSNRLSGASVWLINRNALAVFSLGLLIILVGLFSLILTTFIRGYWYLGGLLALFLALSPQEWVGIVQLTLLALALAALLRLARVVFAKKGNSEDDGDESWSTSLSAWTKQLLTGAVFFAVQPVQAAPQEADSKTSQRPSYKILIPENSSQVYVPTALKDLLQNPVKEEQLTSAGILEARYELKIGDSLSSSSVLLADFRVFAPSGDTELPIPIDPQDLSLLYSLVNGQANELQIEQRTDRVVFLPDMAGEHSLLLAFRPSVEVDVNNTNSVRALVPQVPASSLRVTRPRELSVDCLIQGVPVEVPAESRLTLGPVDELDIRWSASVSPEDAAVTGYDSEVWIKATGSQLVATATIRIEQAKALGKQFSVLFGDDWKPIGADWGDVRMLSVLKEPLGNRQLYQVTPKVPLSDTTELTINVLLAPVASDQDSLSTPFPQVAGLVVPVTRTLLWSSRDSEWQCEGTLFWPRSDRSQSPNSPSSGSTHRLAESWEAYRVPQASPASRLVRQVESERSVVNETNSICYLDTEARIEYLLEVASEDDANLPFRFQIPSTSRIESLLINGLDSEFELVNSGGQTLLLALPPVNTQDLVTNSKTAKVEIKLVHPVALGRPLPIQRIIASDIVAAMSVVEIYHKPGVKCQISSKQDELALPLASPNAASTDLTKMRVKLLEWDWEDQYRYSCDLPADVQIDRADSNSQIQSVLYVDRVAGDWFGRLVTHWNWQPDQFDFVYFRVPKRVRESLSLPNEIPNRYLSTGDPTFDVLVCVPPASGPNKHQVEMSFPVQSGSSVQTIAIPGIEIIGRESLTPVLSLPKYLDENLIEWIDAGAQVAPDWNDPFIEADKAVSRDYRVAREGQLQVLWEAADRSSRKIACELSLLRVSELSANRAVGRIDYWLRPNGQSTFQLKIPEELEILGVVAGNQLANWSQSGDETNVLLQPNYLPIKVRLLVRWNLKSQKLLRLPSAACLSETTPLVVEAESQSAGLTSTSNSLANGTSVIGIWRSILEGNKSLLQGLAAAEREAWLQGWHPNEVGIGVDDQVLMNEDDEQQFVSVVDFWTQTCDSLMVMPPAKLARDIEFGDGSLAYRAGNRSFETGYGDLEPITSATESNSSNQWWVAGILLGFVVVVPSIARAARDSYMEVLVTHPWTYWLQLAGLAYLLLPVNWPSTILLLTSCGMALSQWLEYRRMHRYR